MRICSAPCSCSLQSINPKPFLQSSSLCTTTDRSILACSASAFHKTKNQHVQRTNTQTQTEMGPPPFWILELQTLDGVWISLFPLTQQHVKSLALPPSRTLSFSRRRGDYDGAQQVQAGGLQECAGSKTRPGGSCGDCFRSRRLIPSRHRQGSCPGAISKEENTVLLCSCLKALLVLPHPFRNCRRILCSVSIHVCIC